MVVSLKSTPKKEEVFTPPPLLAKAPQKRKGRLTNILGLLLFLLVAGVGSYMVIDFGSVAEFIPQLSSSPEESVSASGDTEVADIAALEQEVSEVIAAIGKHILLPDGEEPTVATVSDPDKLKDQLFFKHAKAGDKVLIYTKAKMAYLYDPKKDILLEVAPITTDAP